MKIKASTNRKAFLQSNGFRIMVIVIITIILMLQPHSSSAQTINNNLNLYIGYSSVSMDGDSLFRSGSFVAPALYNNFQSTWGLFIKGSYKVLDFVSVGADYNWHTFSDWNTSYSNLYNRMELNIYSLTPFIELRTPQTHHGILNYLSLFTSIGPVLGSSGFKSRNTPWNVRIHTEYRNEISLSDTEMFRLYGYKYTLGGQWNLSRHTGVFASFSGFSNRVQPFAFPDKKYNGTEVTLGVYFRFMSKKRFYR